MKALPNSEQRNRIAALYQRLASIAGDSGIVALRTNELNREHDSQVAFAAALSEATRLKNAVESMIARKGELAQTVSARAISQIQVGRMLLIVLSVARSRRPT